MDASNQFIARDVPDPDAISEAEFIAKSAEADAEAFGLYLDAAIPELTRLSVQYRIPRDAMIALFLGHRSSDAVGAVAGTMEELSDAMRDMGSAMVSRRDPDDDEPWKGE